VCVCACYTLHLNWPQRIRTIDIECVYAANELELNIPENLNARAYCKPPAIYVPKLLYYIKTYCRPFKKY